MAIQIYVNESSLDRKNIKPGERWTEGRRHWGRSTPTKKQRGSEKEEKSLEIKEDGQQYVHMEKTGLLPY